MSVRLMLVIGVCGVATLAGCALLERNQPGATFGQIFVGSPRVEGRERLINDRREQEAWLRDRLKKLDDAPFSVSGASDIRNLSSTAAQLGLVSDPNSGLNALNRDREANQIRQAADDERALGGFRASARDQIIARFNKQELTADQAKSDLEKIGLTIPTAAVSTAAKPVADAASVAARSVNNMFLADGAKVRPPSDDPRRVDLNVTPIEEFSERLAAREVIRNELNAIRLDDLHDLNGNTIYRLTFDATVKPENDTSAWAVVRMTIKPLDSLGSWAQRTESRAKELYLRNLKTTTEAMYRSMLTRLAGKCFEQEAAALTVPTGNDDARHVAFRRAVLCASDELGRTTRRNLEGHLSSWTPARDRAADAVRLSREQMMDQFIRRPADREGSAAYTSRRATLHAWAAWLGSVHESMIASEFETTVLACFYDLAFVAKDARNAPRAQPPGPFQLELNARSSVSAKREQCEQESGKPQTFLERLKQNVSGSVYAVTPKESVQRLSEVGSNRTVREFLLNLSATSSSAGLAAGIQSIRANDALFQAIRRQPLVVGVTESGRYDAKCANKTDSACGEALVVSWVLGPAFQLRADGKTTNFRHVVAQKSLSAELSLPAWMESVDVSYETFWVREDGAQVKGAPDDIAKWSARGRYRVELPSQPMEALAAIDERSLREPRVDEYQFLDIQQGEEAHVLVTGRNLWRSTQLLLGTQEATRLQVLPDNRGIVASFDKIRPPFGANTWNRDSVYLTLVTSEGRVEAGRVKVVPPKGEPDNKSRSSTSVVGAVPRVVAGAEYRFVLAAALLPTDETTVRVQSKKDVKLNVLLDKATQLDDDRRTVIFVLPATEVPRLTSGDPISIDLVVKHIRGGVELIDVVKEGVYYKADEDERAKASASRSKAADTLTVKITLPKQASTAFRSLAGGKAVFVGKLTIPGVAGDAAVEGECSVSGVACAVKWPVKVQLREPLGKAKATDLKLSGQLKGEDVPLLPETITIE